MGAEEPVLDRGIGNRACSQPESESLPVPGTSRGRESALHAETTGSSGLLLLTNASKLIGFDVIVIFFNDIDL